MPHWQHHYQLLNSFADALTLLPFASYSFNYAQGPYTSFLNPSLVLFALPTSVIPSMILWPLYQLSPWHGPFTGALPPYKWQPWVTHQKIRDLSASTGQLPLVDPRVRPLTSSAPQVLYHSWPCTMTPNSQPAGIYWENNYNSEMYMWQIQASSFPPYQLSLLPWQCPDPFTRPFTSLQMPSTPLKTHIANSF